MLRRLEILANSILLLQHTSQTIPSNGRERECSRHNQLQLPRVFLPQQLTQLRHRCYRPVSEHQVRYWLGGAGKACRHSECAVSGFW